MASKNTSSQQRTRINPITGATESIPGTKAGKKRNRLPVGHPLRTHDIKGVAYKKKKLPPLEE